MFLRINEVEHLLCIHWLFGYVFAKYLFKLLAHFFVGSFVIFLLICSINQCLYILGVSLLLNGCIRSTSPFPYSLPSMLLVICFDKEYLVLL